MIPIKANKEEIEALAGLIDAGLRATGLRAAKMAALWADKLQQAIKEYEKELSGVKGDKL